MCKVVLEEEDADCHQPAASGLRAVCMCESMLEEGDAGSAEEEREMENQKRTGLCKY